MPIHLLPLNDLENKHIKNFVDIFNNDIKLIKILGRGKELLSCSRFVAENEQWAEKNNAKIFAIIMGHDAIGLISLSKINKRTKTAKIGYWIASKYWNRGCVSDAFRQVLDLAKNADIKSVSCSIPKENIASKAIWQKFNANFKNKGGFIVPQIYL